MRWFLMEFESNAHKCFRYTKFVVIDETLQNVYASYNCDFKVYTKYKPENYGLLFRVLTDAQYRYASKIIPYVTPLTNNLEKKGKCS